MTGMITVPPCNSPRSSSTPSTIRRWRRTTPSRTTENTAITAGNVFANNGSGVDNDPDGGAFLVTAVSGGTLGTQLTLPSGALLTVNADGTFSYDPNHLFDYLPTPGSGASNLTITDTFSYTITGGDTATVTVTVSGVDTNDVLLRQRRHRQPGRRHRR